ncbi:hypothetical protein Mp_7g08460 [Marchantia polymorpha subsp. ruderalis]|uniref:Uncharacterized protein n=2 Tax=Marchantia polymorpha TaxID=3197 RepID=A0AAF6BXE9_MARPO|nr:hypothetical protein MARPO_0146s0046 [Marchantia polymorpha]BBN16683.1 hypothetical protein Mp_7g08460 [Marchantia polymorpha subsp. ruderalis]|eukprot:PTQ29231.1 hypothetical protein MARPO_0146s0046 [Marchantia polymorpha]
MHERLGESSTIVSLLWRSLLLLRLFFGPRRPISPFPPLLLCLPLSEAHPILSRSFASIPLLFSQISALCFLPCPCYTFHRFLPSLHLFPPLKVRNFPMLCVYRSIRETLHGRAVIRRKDLGLIISSITNRLECLL